MSVKPIPDGYHTLTPHLMVSGAIAALEFYKQAFGAVELFRMADPAGQKIGHAEIQIGTSRMMLADEYPEMGFRSPKTLGGAAVSLMLYVEDSDKVTEQAIKAGAKVLRPIQDQFYGDRSATVEDPFGHVWTISTRKEDVPPEELDRRAKAMYEKNPPS